MNYSTSNADYYVYAYLRTDGSPYYIGKGKNRRWAGPHTVGIPPIDRVKFLAENLTESDAFLLEASLIVTYGRKDLGTGILRNLTSGGEGQTPGPTVKAKLSAAKKGKRPNNFGKSFSSQPGSPARSNSKSGPNHPYYGKTRTAEERSKISAAIKATWDRPIQTCPHCGKQGKVGMTRWHFDNCKALNIGYKGNTKCQ